MKKPWRLCAICLLIAFALIWLFLIAPISPDAPRSPLFYVLTQGDNGLLISQIKQGARAAADRLHASLVFESIQHPEEQIARIQRSGADGVIFFTTDAQNEQAILAASDAQKLPALQIGHSQSPLSVWCDEYQAGVQLAQAALDAGHTRFLLLTEDGASTRDRLDGALSLLESHQPEILPYSSFTPTFADGDAPCVIALGALATAQALSARYDSDCTWPLLGMSIQLRYNVLEDGYADLLLCPAPFSMGFLAVSRMHEHVGGAHFKQPLLVPYASITLDNLYEAKHITFAIPFL